MHSDAIYDVKISEKATLIYVLCMSLSLEESEKEEFRMLTLIDVSLLCVFSPVAPINSLQQFKVITKGAGKADISVAITTPSGAKVQAHVIPYRDGFLVNFTPNELGEYLLSISFGGEPISPAPYRLVCTPGCDATKVRASGPGLEKGFVNKPAEFMIDTRGAGQGGLGVTVEGPCEAAINCRDNGDGTCCVAYLPTVSGLYSINITFNDDPIPGSPFQAMISHEPDLSKIRVSGNGIQPHGTTIITVMHGTSLLYFQIACVAACY